MASLYFIGSHDEFASVAQESAQWHKVLLENMGQRLDSLPVDLQVFDQAGSKGAILAQCQSTFDSLLLLQEQCHFADWDWLIACRQSEGRGQYGRQWHSPVGNLFVSQILPALELAAKQRGLAQNQTLLPLLIGSAFVRALQSLGLPAALKWPNDIVKLQNGSDITGKVGGLLLEQKRGSLLLGWGLNLNPITQLDIDETKCKLFSLPGLPVDYLELNVISHLSILELWQYCQSQLQAAWIRWQDMQTESLITEIEEVLAWLGREVEFFEWSNHQDTGSWQRSCGRLRGLGQCGELLLETAAGRFLKVRGSLRPINYHSYI